MKTKKKAQAVFKPYASNQIMLLPPSLEELIDENHPVRVVNQVIDRIDIAPLLKKFKGGGTSSYHPKMLLKVLVFSYLNNVYSSRRMEALVKESIPFMWLAGMNKPDHNTINRFRSDKLKDVLKQVFKQIVLLLAEAGLVDLKELYLDGTKVEANANRYTFVWGNSIKTNKERIRRQLNDLWDYAQSVAAEELQDTSPVEFNEINPGKVSQTIEKIDTALKGKSVDKKVKQKLGYARRKWPQSLEKYQQQEQTLKGRKSYSKTDTDATFMRMKDDYMKNGQLKPGYNWQISTNNQVITNYTIHPNPTDTTTLVQHMEQHKELYGQNPDVLTADAGYGSQENYEYLENNKIEAYVKYNYFHKEQKQKQDDPFNSENFYYNPEKDCYYCPMGQQMLLVGQRTRTTDNGFVQHYKIYQAQNCTGCPLRGLCHNSKKNRQIQVNHKLRHLKARAREKLLSEKGIYHRKKRPADVEAVFGIIKGNHGFKRFLLKGKPKVEIEAGLIAIAHNLRKMVA
jgi:transposase